MTARVSVTTWSTMLRDTSATASSLKRNSRRISEVGISARASPISVALIARTIQRIGSLL
jgi:hypothetical protein